MAGLAVKRAAAGLAVAGLVGLIGLTGLPASAQTIEVPITQSFASGAPGSTTALGSVPVPANLVGRSCTAQAVVTNQESIHPGNTLIITSGASSVSVAGIEETPGSVTSQAGVLTLGDSITVSLQFGNDGLSSLGSNLTVTCAPIPAQTTVVPVTTTVKYSG
jgi:hypothetical protein